MIIGSHAIDVIILAGGKISRMDGKFKGSLAFRNEEFLESIVKSVQDRESNIFLSYASEEQAKIIPDGCTVIYDTVQGIGPLGGLISGLEACSTEYAAVCACDMPLISPALYQFLWDHMTITPDGRPGDVIMPRTEDGVHPLAALYRRDLLPALKDAVRRGERKLLRIIQNLNTVTVEIMPLSPLEPEVTNINTVSEYAALIESDPFRPES